MSIAGLARRQFNVLLVIGGLVQLNIPRRGGGLLYLVAARLDLESLTCAVLDDVSAGCSCNGNGVGSVSASLEGRHFGSHGRCI